MIGAPITTIRSANDDGRNGSGVTTADIPRMTRRFMILDPTTLPIAISELPRRAAMIDVVSSGVLVPIAMTVNPMIDSESPRTFARSTAPSTRILPPIRRTVMPPKIHSHAFHGLAMTSTFSLTSGTKLLCFTL